MGLDALSALSALSAIVGSGSAPNPPGYDEWLARAEALGASPPEATKTAVSAFFAELDTRSIPLADFDYIYLMIGEASGDTSANKYNQKRVNLANPGVFDATITRSNTSGHAADGTLGNNDMYWDTGLSSDTRLVDRTNNASWGEVVTNFNGEVAGVMDGGWEDGAGNAGYMATNYDPLGGIFAYGGGSSIVVGSPAVPSMVWMNCITMNTEAFYNIVSQGSNASATGSLQTRSITIFATNFITPVNLCKSTIAFAWHGKALTGANVGYWYSAVQTLMAAFSVTI